MLQNLFIKNYALIKELNLNIDGQLTTITGETGAGKSILLGAIGLILGQRADNSAIADQTEKCIIEATFDIHKLNLLPLFEEFEIDYQELTIIRREILPNGKSRSFINDTPANLSQLKQIGSHLIEIHTQNTGLLVTEPTEQLHLVDGYGNYPETLKKYKLAFKSHQEFSSKLNRLLENQKSYIKEKAFIQFQFDELNDFNLIENEEISLDENIKLLTQASGIISALATAQKVIIENDQSILDQLAFIKNQLKPIIGAHQSIQELFSRIESSIIELKDIGLEAENIAEKIDNNPANLELSNERLAKLQNLFRKHQVETAIDLIELKNSFENQLVVSQNIDDEISSVKKHLETSRMQVVQIGKEITQLRTTASKQIAEEAKGILVNLAIPHAAIEFKIETNENNLGPNGLDYVDILFSANLGKSPQPLANVASGGEISRLNFTFRSLIAKNKNLPTLIYDEADTGISGDVASKMGSMMRQLGQFHQVISITHLPQVAAAGQTQWLVYKSISDNKTLSSVKKLNLEDRIQVLAQMLSGFNPSDSALSNARELIGQY